MTVGEFKKIIANIPDEKEIEFSLQTQVSEEELAKMSYPYPYRNHTLTFAGYDIGWSEGKCEIFVSGDVAPVVHAHWIPCEDLWGNIDPWKCSCCGCDWTCIDGTPAENNMKFCPECGAIMDEEVE